MAALRKHFDFVRLVSVGLAGTLLSACMTWQTQSLRPERFRTADSTQAMRLTLTSGYTIIVQAPVITGDSLVGMQTRPGSVDSLQQVSLPLTAISRAEMKKTEPSAGKLALGILLGLALGEIIVASIPCILCPGH
jgi:hypothetical protein